VMAWSLYTEITRAEWARLRADTTLTLTPEDLLRLQGLNERVAMEEVVDIYLPLADSSTSTSKPSRYFTELAPRFSATRPPRCHT
jgi:pantothenate kinase